MSELPDFSPYGADDNRDLLAALGLVVQQHGMLDLSLRELFCQLVTGKYAIALAAEMQTRGLVKSCRTLIKGRRAALADGYAKDLTTWLAKADAANGRRNELVHSLWVANERIDKLGRPSAPVQSSTESAASLLQVADELRRAGTEVLLLAQRLPDTGGIGQLGFEKHLRDITAEEFEAHCAMRFRAENGKREPTSEELSQRVASDAYAVYRSRPGDEGAAP